MRRLFAVTAGFLFTGLLAAPFAFGSAKADDTGTVAKYCRDHRDFGLSHGGCVAQFTAGNTTPHNASVCKMAWVRAWVGVENEGACVTALNEMSR